MKRPSSLDLSDEEQRELSKLRNRKEDLEIKKAIRAIRKSAILDTIADEELLYSDAHNEARLVQLFDMIQGAFESYQQRKIERRCDTELVNSSIYARAASSALERCSKYKKPSHWIEQIFSTHPQDSERAEYMAKLAKELEAQGK